MEKLFFGEAFMLRKEVSEFLEKGWHVVPGTSALAAGSLALGGFHAEAMIVLTDETPGNDHIQKPSGH